MADFNGHSPRKWKGRYNRGYGEDNIFRIKYYNDDWWPIIVFSDDEGSYTCPAEMCDASGELTHHVNLAKKLYGKEGGSFIINEFGQVIVPSPKGDGVRYIVGEFSDMLLFEHPEADEWIDLNDDEGYDCGDAWEMPYIGCRFSLKQNGKIGYKYKGEDYEEFFPADIQDHSLIRKLRSIRGNGGCGFIVNPEGIVLTKRDTREGWLPVYVGRIDYNKWFEKEE